MAGIGFSSTNYVTKAGNGLGPRTLIVNLVREDSGALTQANLDAFVKALGNAGGSGNGSDQDGPDAFTVAGISTFTAGSTTSVYLALQGTGTFTTDTDDALGITGLSATLITTFADNV